MKEQDSIIAKMESSDSIVNQYLKTINEIEDNLAIIKERESLIGLKASQNVEYGNNQGESIVMDIKSIDNLLKDNRKKLASLNESLFQSGLENSELSSMIRKLEGRIQHKEDQITNLESEVLKVNGEKKVLSETIVTLENSVDTLTQLANFFTSVVDAQRETISTIESALNEVFYRVDTKANLKEEEIIRKEGGIFGIRSTLLLNENIDDSEFVSEDKESLIAVPLKTNNPKLITNHPIDSYKVELNVDKNKSRLLIIDPDKFWQKSRYLVVVRN